jgi:hypothetical protein
MTKTRNWLAILPIIIMLPWARGSAQDKGKTELPDPQVAVGCLRTINTADVVYSSTYAKGYSPTLAAMGMKAGSSNPSPEAAELIDESLSGGKKAGYVFTYKPGPKDKSGRIATYTVVARPQKWQDGVVSFFSDESGVIRWTKANRAPSVKDPAIDTLTDSKKQ